MITILAETIVIVLKLLYFVCEFTTIFILINSEIALKKTMAYLTDARINMSRGVNIGTALWLWFLNEPLGALFATLHGRWFSGGHNGQSLRELRCYILSF